MYKKLLTNSAIYGILPQLPKIASFFVLPLTTPFLTKTDYGIIGVLSAYIGALSVFHLLGLNVVVTNAYYHYRKQYKWYWRQLYGFVWLWSPIYFLMLGSVIYLTLPTEAIINRWEIIIMKVLPLLLFSPSEMLATTYFRLKQKAVPIATRALGAGLVGVVLNYTFIAIFKMGYMGWILSEFITNCITGIVFSIPVLIQWKLTPIFNFKIRLIKKALKVSLPIIPHYYGSYLLNSSDRVVMERLNVPVDDIGRYSLAYNFGVYIETITNAINQAIGPNLLELIRDNRWKDYEKLIIAFQSLILIMCFTISLWIPQWVPLLIRNKELQNIYILLIVIIMSYSCRPMYIGCNQVLFYYEKTNVLWKVTFIAGIINLVGNLLFIPAFGVTAAAVTTFISLLYMGFSGFLFEVVKSNNKARLYPLYWFILIVLSTSLATLFHDDEITLKIGINALMAVIYSFLLFKKILKD